MFFWSTLTLSWVMVDVNPFEMEIKAIDKQN